MSNAYNERFTEEEWFLLVSLPSMIGAAVSGAAKSGVLGTVKEAMANVKAVMGAKEEYAGNPLIQSLIVKADDREEAKATIKRFNEMAKAKLESRGVKSPEKLIEVMLDDCGRAADLLDAKCESREMAGYKDWAVGVGEKVAQAAKEGGFLGFGGERVSEAETQMLSQIKTALRV